MRGRSLVGVLKTSSGVRGAILTLLSGGAFACTEVNLEPVAVAGSAGSHPNAGSSGSAGRGGTSGGNGGSAATAGAGGTTGTAGAGGLGEGGSSGTTGSGGTGGGDTGPINFVTNPDFEQGSTPAPWTMIAQQGMIVLSTDCDPPQEPDVVTDAGVTDAGVTDAGVTDAGAAEPEPSHGLRCGRGTGRTDYYQGPAYPLTGVLTRGKTYTVSAYGRIDKASSSVLKLTMRVMCQGLDGVGMPIGYTNLVPETPVTDREWLFMTGEYTVPSTEQCPTINDLRFYLEGPPGEVDILVDDASVYER